MRERNFNIFERRSSHMENISRQLSWIKDQKVVEFLKNQGFKVEMTEDGINDLQLRLFEQDLKLVIEDVVEPSVQLNPEQYQACCRTVIRLDTIDEADKDDYMFCMKNYPSYYHSLYERKLFTLKPGVTILVGKNGSGKSTFFKELRHNLEENNIPVFDYDNLDSVKNASQNYMDIDQDMKKVIQSTMINSEGQNILYNLGEVMGKIGDFVRKNIQDHKKVFLLLDGLDSGLSIDNILELRGLFELILLDKVKENKIFIVVSANTFELARDYDCLYVKTGEHMKFTEYEDYKKFVIRK